MKTALASRRPFEIISKKIFLYSSAFVVLIFTISINFGLRSPGEISSPSVFKINYGDSFLSITNRLKDENLIRSPLAFKVFAFLTGSASHLKPGVYELSPNLNGSEIIKILLRGGESVTVTIPEGLSIKEVDKILSDQKVILIGDLVEFSKDNNIEGRLSPDTYKFFTGSEVKDVVNSFLKNFDEKIKPILDIEPDKFETNLILASLVQEEVSDPEDAKGVAAVIEKRLKVGMPLQLDATICYIKKQLAKEGVNCYPITKLDFKIDSPYNTYQHRGLPPGPIASPGVSAVRAVLDKNPSPYWFYLSDPKTGKTHFSETLEEHNQKVLLYLKNKTPLFEI